MLSVALLGTSKVTNYKCHNFELCADDVMTFSVCLLRADAMLLLEVDRVRKPGGYFVLTSPTNKAQGNSPDTKKTSISTRVNELSKRICWSLIGQQDETFLWQKTTDSNCYSSR